MAELADASDSKSDIARCVGSTPTPGTIFTKPSEIFVPAVSFFLRMRERNEKTIQILKAFRLRFQKSYSIIESIDDSHDRQNGACDIQGRFCKRVSARRSNARAFPFVYDRSCNLSAGFDESAFESSRAFARRFVGLVVNPDKSAVANYFSMERARRRKRENYGLSLTKR